MITEPLLYAPYGFCQLQVVLARKMNQRSEAVIVVVILSLAHVGLVCSVG
jgi:hypothetical protein